MKEGRGCKKRYRLKELQKFQKKGERKGVAKEGEKDEEKGGRKNAVAKRYK